MTDPHSHSPPVDPRIEAGSVGSVHYVRVGEWMQCAHCRTVNARGGSSFHFCGAPWQTPAHDIPADWVAALAELQADQRRLQEAEEQLQQLREEMVHLHELRTQVRALNTGMARKNARIDELELKLGHHLGTTAMTMPNETIAAKARRCALTMAERLSEGQGVDAAIRDAERFLLTAIAGSGQERQGSGVSSAAFGVSSAEQPVSLATGESPEASRPTAIAPQPPSAPASGAGEPLETIEQLPEPSKNLGPFAPHPLGATLGPRGIDDRRKTDPLLVAEFVRLLERHGVLWTQAVREVAGLTGWSTAHIEEWWCFDTCHADSPTDAEMIRLKREECAQKEAALRAPHAVEGTVMKLRADGLTLVAVVPSDWPIGTIVEVRRKGAV